MYDPDLERRPFPLDAIEFLCATSHLDTIQLGGLIKLLCFSWANKRLPLDHKSLKRLSGLPSSKFNDVILMFTKNATSYKYAPMEEVRADMDKPVYVYIAIHKENGTYKIGASRDIWKREVALRGKKQNVRMLYYFKGGFAKEAELHRYFATKRIDGEWFNLDEDDLSYILSNHEIMEA